jgi:hypothetical protein
MIMGRKLMNGWPLLASTAAALVGRDIHIGIIYPVNEY